MDVRLGDDLHERHAGAVQVDIRCAALVHGAPRILLQMNAVNADAAGRAVGKLDVKPAIFALGQLVLGDLVALGKIGVGVVLARKDGSLVNAAIERQARADGRLDGGAVGNGQAAGQPQAHGTGARVGGRTGVIRGAGAEHLGAALHLCVHLHAHHQFVARGDRVCGVAGGLGVGCG